MKLVSTFIVIILGVVSTFAQERVIDKVEFDLALKGTDQHKTKWQGRSYRLSVETSARIDGKPDSDYSARMLIEFGPDRNTRSVLISRFGDSSTTQETRSLGDKTYSRTNGGPWVTKERKAASASDRKPDEAGPFVTISADATYFRLGERPFKEAAATVYRKVENTKEVFRSTGVESTSVCTTEYWLVDGIQRRHDLTCQHRRPTQIANNVVNQSWDLDPTIVIREP